MRAADIEDNSELWKGVLTTTDFADWIKHKYTLVSGNLIASEDADG
jgi:hypothetical protein